MFLVCTQHASADVEKMILGNKCDINDKRQVSKDRGEKVWFVLFGGDGFFPHTEFRNLLAVWAAIKSLQSNLKLSERRTWIMLKATL